MKLTNNQIEFIYTQAVKMRQDGLKFPIKTGFAVLRNIKTLEPIVEDLMSARQEILETNGKIDESNPVQYIIEPDKVDYVNKELTNLDNMELEVALIKVDLDTLTDMEITIDELQALSYMADGVG